MIYCQKLKCPLRTGCLSKYTKNFHCKIMSKKFHRIPKTRELTYYDRLNSDW